MEFRIIDLDRAVDAGVITAATRDRLACYLATVLVPADEAGPDAENFRLLTGFNDIFVALACGLLLVAVASLTPFRFGSLLVAATAWGLAEYFTRQRRMALPSILLLVAFVGSIFYATLSAIGFGSMMPAGNVALFDTPGIVAAGAAATVAAAAHWWRFRVPITLAAGAGGVAIMAIALAVRAASPALLLPAMLLCGLAIFALAMRYDMADRSRTTRRTDIAFWLHLLAAPMIVHPVFAMSGLTTGLSGPPGALLVLIVYLALTFVALAIDRRALLVSALAYVLIAFNSLFAAGGIVAGFGLTALILGGFLVTLSAAWSGLRRRLVAQLPAHWQSRLPAAAG